MRIRVCQRNMKAQQDCKQAMERAALRKKFAAIFKKKNVIIITDKPTSAKIYILQPVSVAELAGLTLP